MLNIKKAITGILAAAVVVSQCAAPGATAFAAEAEDHCYYDSVGDCYYYTVNDDGESATITGYDGEGGDVSIPEDIDGMNVTSIGNAAFEKCYNLTSVKIPDGVTSIGENAFDRCEDLTSVIIPNGVTSIENETFRFCTSLKEITIPEDVVSIGSFAFSYCQSLKSITIPDGVKSIGDNAFEECAIKSIILPDGLTSILAETFMDCADLISVTIPKSVTSIGEWAFSGCVSLTDVYFTGSELEWDAITFGWMNDVTRATIHYNSTGPEIGNSTSGSTGEFTSSGATYQVTSTANNTVKFVSYSGTASKATIPATVTYGGTKYKVTAIAANAFSGNKNITSVTIGKNVKKIGNKAFKGCKKLKTVKINSTKLTSVGKNAFKGISSSAKIKVPSDYKKAYKKLLTASGYTGKVKTL